LSYHRSFRDNDDEEEDFDDDFDDDDMGRRGRDMDSTTVTLRGVMNRHTPETTRNRHRKRKIDDDRIQAVEEVEDNNETRIVQNPSASCWMLWKDGGSKKEGSKDGGEVMGPKGRSSFLLSICE